MNWTTFLRRVVVLFLVFVLFGTGTFGQEEDGEAPAFRSRCPFCDRSFRIPPGETTGTGLVVQCSSCDAIVDLLHPDTEGDLHRAPWYLEHPKPPAGLSPMELMNWVRLHIRYVPDGRMHRVPEVWQRARQTYRWRRGDCEDSAILLADWLGASGYQAYVVAGQWRGRQHAWVVLEEDGETYILETTASRGAGRRFLPLVRLMTDYNPTDFMFDDRDVWVRRTRKWTHAYGSPEHWYALRPEDDAD